MTWAISATIGITYIACIRWLREWLLDTYIRLTLIYTVVLSLGSHSAKTWYDSWKAIDRVQSLEEKRIVRKYRTTPDDTNFHCDICGRGCASRSGLYAHIRLWSGGFVAQWLGRWFGAERSRVRLPATALYRVTTLGKFFKTTCLCRCTWSSG